MAELNLNFTQEEIDNANKSEFDPLPAGNYVAEITHSEIKPTRAGTGTILSLGFKVIDGDFAGRLVFSNINLSNPNEIAQQIGRKQLAQIAAACGIANIKDTEQLHGVPMTIKVGFQKDDKERNEIKEYRPASTSFSAPPPSPTTKSNKPWLRSA